MPVAIRIANLPNKREEPLFLWQCRIDTNIPNVPERVKVNCPHVCFLHGFKILENRLLIGHISTSKEITANQPEKRYGSFFTDWNQQIDHLTDFIWLCERRPANCFGLILLKKLLLAGRRSSAIDFVPYYQAA